MLSFVEAASWATEWPLLGLLAGFVLLVSGANLLVRGAVWVALQLGMSRLAVGLTLVAFGTSMPELLVSLTSAMEGESEIAMGNVIGSNNMNVLLIVGATAVIRPIYVRLDRLELVHMLVAAALLATPFVFGSGLTRPLAAVMFAQLILFCGQLLRRERRSNVDPHPDPAAEREAEARATLFGWLSNVAIACLGLAMLTYGADWLIDGAKVTAESMGMSKALVGATIVAGGTSLPELATSAIAARKGHPEIAIGNVLGSNIFNVGSVLGVCGLIHPFDIDRAALAPVLISSLVAAAWLAALLAARRGVGRLAGTLFLLAMCGYVVIDAWVSGSI